MENSKYIEVMNEIISKQIVILGPDISIMKAKSIKGLSFDDEGKIVAIDGDGREVMQRLIDVYVELSGQIVKIALGSIFTKYPEVDHSLDI